MITPHLFLSRYVLVGLLAVLHPILINSIYSDSISVEDLFKESKAGQFTLSPDGSYIALIARNEEHKQCLYTRELDTGETHAWTLEGASADVADYSWMNNERLLFRVTAPSRGTLKWFSARRDQDKFFVFNLGGRINHVIDPLINRDPILVLRPNEVESTLVEVHPMTALPLKTVGTFPDYVRGVTVDLDGQARILLVGEEWPERRRVYREANGEPWSPLDLPIDCHILGFGPGGNTILVSDYFGRERSALYRYDLIKKELSAPIFEDPIHDLHSSIVLILDVSRKHPLGIRYHADRETTVWFSPEMQQIQQILDDRNPKTINKILSADIKSGHFLFRSYSDHQPSVYRLLDYQERRISDLWSTRPQIDPEKMASTEPFTFTSRDGLPLRGYLTLPPSGSGPHPTVTIVHGGPWVRDTWGFDAVTQFLASRNYAVLKINYRGSTGFGYKVSHHPRGDLRAMNDDIEDGVRWAIEQGHTDGERVGIMGASFGGYAAVYGVAFKPALYRCAIGNVGVYDWPKHIGSLKKDREWAFHQMIEYFGDDYGKTLRPLSPINYVDQISAPVFIAFGKQDSNVSPAQSKRMINELKKIDNAPTVYSKHWEGHGFFDDNIQFDYYRAIEAFLAENL